MRDFFLQRGIKRRVEIFERRNFDDEAAPKAAFARRQRKSRRDKEIFAARLLFEVTTRFGVRNFARRYRKTKRIVDFAVKIRSNFERFRRGIFDVNGDVNRVAETDCVGKNVGDNAKRRIRVGRIRDRVASSRRFVVKGFLFKRNDKFGRRDVAGRRGERRRRRRILPKFYRKR